jgi:hypothetical protein
VVSSSATAGMRLAPLVFRRRSMPQQTLARRVAILEEKVTPLEALPERVDRIELQIEQLRNEMHDEFSAVGTERRGGLDALRHEMRAEIRAGDEEMRRFMRGLHEDVIARIAAIGEWSRSSKKRR